MKKIITISSLIILNVIFLFISFQISNIKPVTATKLNTTHHSQYVNAIGELECAEKENIIMSFPLYIKEVFVKENSYINKGQSIFSLDKEKMLDLMDMQSNKNTQNILREIDNIPEHIYATSSGIISDLNISNNSVALSGDILCSISKSDSIMAKFTLDQLDYGKIEIGDEVSMTSVAFDKQYSGKISNQPAIIYKEVSSFNSSTKVDVFAEFDKSDYSLIDGLQVNGKIKINTLENMKILDYQYINQDKVGEFVYIIKNNKAKKEYIETGLEIEIGVQILTYFNEDTIFIKGDISENDLVVISDEK